MSEGVSNLEEFLERAQSGGALEATSSFRIDAASAVSRLSDFRLPSPFHWVVKVVQWANAVGAESVSFKIGRRKYEATVAGSPPKSAEQVLREMLTVNTLSDHLVTALLSLAREDTPSFELEIRGPEHHDAFHYSHKERIIAGSDSRGLETTGLRLTVQGKGWRPLQQHHVYLHKLIYEVCWSSPVPLKVDGREPEVRYSARHPVSFRPALYPLSFGLGWAAVPPLAGRPRVRLRLPETQDFQPLEKASSFGKGFARENVPDGQMFLVYLPQGPVGAYLNIKTSANSAVVFCCDGVEVDRILVEEPIAQFGAPEMMLKVGFEIYCAVETSETDLSGFRVRDREALAESMVACLVGRLLKLWDCFLNCPVDFYTRLIKPKHQRFVDTPLATFSGAAIALSVGTFGGSVVAGVAAAVPVAMVYGKGYDILFLYLKFLSKFSYGSPFRAFGFRESLLELQSRRKVDGLVFEEPGSGDWEDGWAGWPGVGSENNWGLDLLVGLRESSALRKTIAFKFEKATLEVQADLAEGALEPLELIKGRPFLARALAGLARTGPERISLRVGGHHIEWTEASGRLSQTSRPEGSFHLKAEYASPKTEGGFLEGLRAQFKSQAVPFADAITELQEYGWLSPVKIDGRSLDTRISEYPKGRRNVCFDISSTDMPLCLGRRDLPYREGEPWFECPVDDPAEIAPLAGGWVSQSKLDLPATFLYWGDSAPRLSTVVLLTGMQLGNSAIEFVYKGVIVDVFPLYPSEMFRKDEKLTTRIFAAYEALRLMKWPLSLRLLVAVETIPRGPARRLLAQSVLSRYRAEILELIELVEEHLPSLSYKWSAEMFKSRAAAVQQYNLVSTAHKSLVLRRRKIRNTLKKIPQLIDEHSG